ncbi:hypothetical protein, partial [Phycicoccus sp.]|uniref:hypothetical protein n=1 Tax=Phycicoccus sp. TaxID=1902410 RepID=UPI002C9EB823
VAWAAAGSTGSTASGPPVRRTPRPAPSTAGPDDPAWASTTRWPPRGSLAGDPGVAALVATAGNLSRLLYAADAGPLRVVVATDPQVDDPLSSVVRAWSGPAGTAVPGLTVAELGYNGIYDRQDLVAVALPSSGGALVVTLARPDVDGAEVSLAVRPLPDGRIERAWQAVPMTEGVGAVRLERAAGPASRLRMAGYDGPLPHVDPARNGEDLVAAAVADVAACVDVPVGRLAVRTTRFPLPEGAMQEMMGSPAAGTLDVTAVTTPGGGVVRFASYRTGSAESYAAFTDQPLVVPARERDAPFVLQLGTDVEGRPRTIVTSPAQAATVQVLGVDGQVLSRPTRLVGRLAVVTLTTSPADGSDLRIVVRAADGRVVRDAVHVDGRPLYDLSPEGALF